MIDTAGQVHSQGEHRLRAPLQLYHSARVRLNVGAHRVGFVGLLVEMATQQIAQRQKADQHGAMPYRQMTKPVGSAAGTWLLRSWCWERPCAGPCSSPRQYMWTADRAPASPPVA